MHICARCAEQNAVTEGSIVLGSNPTHCSTGGHARDVAPGLSPTTVHVEVVLLVTTDGLRRSLHVCQCPIAHPGNAPLTILGGKDTQHSIWSAGFAVTLLDPVLSDISEMLYNAEICL